MSSRNKKILIFFLLVISFLPMMSVMAETNEKVGDTRIDYNLTKTKILVNREGLGLLLDGGEFNANKLAALLGSLVQPLVVLVGVLLLVIIIISGIIWMTSGGNEERITKAKGMLKNGIIGLVIVTCSYLIVSFIINRLELAVK